MERSFAFAGFFEPRGNIDVRPAAADSPGASRYDRVFSAGPGRLAVGMGVLRAFGLFHQPPPGFWAGLGGFYPVNLWFAAAPRLEKNPRAVWPVFLAAAGARPDIPDFRQEKRESR